MLPDAAVAESRRKIHEALVGSPAWVADTVRDELARLEAAIEARVRAEAGEDIKAFGEATGRAQDPAKIGYLGGLAVAETIARGTEPDLMKAIAVLRQAAPMQGAGQ